MFTKAKHLAENRNSKLQYIKFIYLENVNPYLSMRLTDVSYFRDARKYTNYRIYELLKNKHSSYCIYIYKNYNKELFGSVGTG